jgi:hypothetical protein
LNTEISSEKIIPKSFNLQKENGEKANSNTDECQRKPDIKLHEIIHEDSMEEIESPL